MRHRHLPIFVLLLLLLVGLLPCPSVEADETTTAIQAMEQGQAAYQRGAFGEAAEHWAQAAVLYEQQADRAGQAEAWRQQAEALQRLGQIQAALDRLQAADRVSADAGDRLAQARVKWSAGRLYTSVGQFEDAERALTDAQGTARELKANDLAAAVANDLGNLHAARQQWSQALDAYNEAARLGASLPDQSLAIGASINAARVAMRQAHYADARAYLDGAWTKVEAVPLSRDHLYSLITLGLLYRDLCGALTDQCADLRRRAFHALESAAQGAERLSDTRAASYAWGYLGQLYEAQHQYEEALEMTHRAIFAGQQAVAPEVLFRWHWQDGRVLRNLNRDDDALGAYRRAVYALQSVRPELAGSHGQPAGSFRDTLGRLYYELADLLLVRADAVTDPAKAEVLLKEARDTVERFKVAELRDYFQDDCVDAARSRTAGVEALSKRAVVIYPIMLAERLDLLVSRGETLTRVSVPVSAERLTAEIRQFRHYLEKQTTLEYRIPAQRLYDWLVRPLEPLLADAAIDTLVFVPDGPLRTVPIGALHDGTQFLIAKYAVATTPGLTVTDPRPLNRATMKVLSVGLTESVQGFPALPSVSKEVHTIQDLFGGTVMLDQEFQLEALEQRLKQEPFSVVHIASHGRFGRDARETYLLAFDGKLTMDRLDQFVGVLRFRDEPLALLTLSACETAAGDDEAALGLAGVAIKAGATSALATLWFIDDRASSALVMDFYRILHDNPTMSKAVALQQAQLKNLKNPVYDHPAYWAAFLLLNNWL